MSSTGFHDRRIHARRQTGSLAYVDLGEDNGGLVLNMSEGGMAIHAAVMLAGDHLPKIRFQLPQSQDWIESAGQVTWTGDSRKNAGIEFVGLPEEARAQIRNWLNSSEPAYQPPSVRRQKIDTKRLAALASLPVETAAAEEAIVPPRVADAKSALESTRENGAGDSAAATVPVARNASSEIESPIARPVTGRPRRWAINPTFTQGTPSTGVSLITSSQHRNWMGFVSAGVLLAAASFAIGLATGRGAWTGIRTSARNLMAGKSGPVAAETPPAVTNVAASDNGSSSGGVAQNGTAVSASRSARVQAAGTLDGQSRSGDTSAQTVIVHRAAPLNAAGSANAGGDESSGSVLSMPDTPVSASNSVAVSSRLFIPVPAAGGTPGSQQRAGNVQVGRLENRAEIIYPADAISQRIEGIVKLHITIGADGTIKDAAPMSGAPLLASAALDAVRQWRYKPTTVDGSPIETEADITVVFRFPQTPE